MDESCDLPVSDSAVQGWVTTSHINYFDLLYSISFETWVCKNSVAPFLSSGRLVLNT